MLAAISPDPENDDAERVAFVRNAAIHHALRTLARDAWSSHESQARACRANTYRAMEQPREHAAEIEKDRTPGRDQVSRAISAYRIACDASAHPPAIIDAYSHYTSTARD